MENQKGVKKLSGAKFENAKNMQKYIEKEIVESEAELIEFMIN